MKARFLDGPYKGITLHVGSQQEVVILEVEVHVPDRLNLEGVPPVRCHAHYLRQPGGDQYGSAFRLLGLRPAT